MGFKYVAIEYSGTYQNILHFFESKEWSFEIKNVGKKTLFLKIDQEMFDEVMFFKNCDISENGSKQTNKILNVKEITEREFASISDNGFEIIDKQEKERSSPPSQKVSDDMMIQEIKVESNEERKNIFNQVSEILANTSLPSKSPLPAEDPFAFMTSPNYLLKFIVVATLILFILGLIELNEKKSELKRVIVVGNLGPCLS